MVQTFDYFELLDSDNYWEDPEIASIPSYWSIGTDEKGIIENYLYEYLTHVISSEVEISLNFKSKGRTRNM